MHLNSYGQLFKAPGTKAFSIAAFIARFPMAMITLGIVTMLSQMRDGYSLAGTVAGTFALTNAFIAPQLSRAADRFGQTRIALPATLISASGLSALLLCAHFEAPNWTLFIFAAFAGCMPSFGAFVRTRWSKVYRGSPLLRTAFAFESLVDEIIFMIGPVIAIKFSLSIFPEAGILAAILLLLTGCFLFIRQKRTEPDIAAPTEAKQRSVIRYPSVIILAITLSAVGIIFGTIEVTAIAFAKFQDQADAALYPLVAYAIGSFITGVLYGALNIRMPLQKQLIVAMGIAALTTLPLLLVNDIWVLAGVLAIAGAACSPSMIICMALIESLVPARNLTEGMTWAVTGIGIGLAAGSAISGQLIDAFGVRAGFSVAIIAGFSALTIAILCNSKLKATSTLHDVIPAGEPPQK